MWWMLILYIEYKPNNINRHRKSGGFLFDIYKKFGNLNIRFETLSVEPPWVTKSG